MTGKFVSESGKREIQQRALVELIGDTLDENGAREVGRRGCTESLGIGCTSIAHSQHARRESQVFPHCRALRRTISVPDGKHRMSELKRRFQQFANSFGAEQKRLDDHRELYALQLMRSLDLFLLAARRHSIEGMLYYWGWAFYLRKSLEDVERENQERAAYADYLTRGKSPALGPKQSRADDAQLRQAALEMRKRNHRMSAHGIFRAVAKQHPKPNGKSLSYQTVNRAVDACESTKAPPCLLDSDGTAAAFKHALYRAATRYRRYCCYDSVPGLAGEGSVLTKRHLPSETWTHGRDSPSRAGHLCSIIACNGAQFHESTSEARGRGPRRRQHHDDLALGEKAATFLVGCNSEVAASAIWRMR